ncbi:MAG: hypothetical protein QGI45_06835, partial [Myxococcota bacterium]|nr:hypothetical protein [Myxococcota bacterium]
VAARVSSQAVGEQILISEDTRNMLTHGAALSTFVAETELKGKSEAFKLFAIEWVQEVDDPWADAGRQDALTLSRLRDSREIQVHDTVVSAIFMASGNALGFDFARHKKWWVLGSLVLAMCIGAFLAESSVSDVQEHAPVDKSSVLKTNAQETQAQEVVEALQEKPPEQEKPLEQEEPEVARKPVVKPAAPAAAKRSTPKVKAVQAPTPKPAPNKHQRNLAPSGTQWWGDFRQQLYRRLQQRALIPDDLSSFTAAKNQVKALAESGELEKAKDAGNTLEKRIDNLAINETFVQKKLERFNREFAGKKNPALDAKLSPIVAEVFSHYMAKNFTKANMQLTNAFAILRKSR